MDVEEQIRPEVLLERGARAIAAGDLLAARECLSEALDLYRLFGDVEAATDVEAALAGLSTESSRRSS